MALAIYIYISIFLSEFIYCGLILEDDATVESTGLKNGSMVHALKKEEPELSIPIKYVSEDSIIQLTLAFKSFNETPAFRSALHVIILTLYIKFNLIISIQNVSLLHTDYSYIVLNILKIL